MDSTEIVDDFDSAFDEFAEGEVSAELAPEDTEVVAETEEVGEVGRGRRRAAERVRQAPR